MDLEYDRQIFWLHCYPLYTSHYIKTGDAGWVVSVMCQTLDEALFF